MLTFINTEDDMSWLYETHLGPQIKRCFKSAVMHGNEDAPHKIELYESANPLITDTPAVFVITE